MNPWKLLGQLERVLARDYLRVSRDRSGRVRSTEEQHNDHRSDCDDNGWAMGASYEDPSIGASLQSRKKRPDFENLVNDLENDRFGAQVLMLWELSRGSRRVREWLDLIELCEARSVYIWVHTNERLYDPANANDRRELIRAAADSEYESSQTSTRIKRSTIANAGLGRPHGRIQWGYRRVYDPRTREFLAQEVEESEAPMVRTLYARLLKGHAFRAIAVYFETKGIRTRSGTPWSPQGLRSVALSPTYAGMRAHIPGRTRGRTKMLELSQLHEGTWPRLVEPGDWFKVQRMLHEPNRRSKIRPGKGKYLLSQIARCGSCGSVLGVAYLRGEAFYRCSGDKGCAFIRMSLLDPYAERLLLDYLTDPDVIAALRARDVDANDELTAVTNELSEQRARHDELCRDIVAGHLSLELGRKTEPVILEKIKELEARFNELNTPAVLRGLIEPGADVGARWSTTPVSSRRRVVTLLLVPELMGELRLAPSPKGRQRVPADERVQWWRRTTDDQHMQAAG